MGTGTGDRWSGENRSRGLAVQHPPEALPGRHERGQVVLEHRRGLQRRNASQALAVRNWFQQSSAPGVQCAAGVNWSCRPKIIHTSPGRCGPKQPPKGTHLLQQTGPASVRVDRENERKVDPGCGRNLWICRGVRELEKCPTFTTYCSSYLFSASHPCLDHTDQSSACVFVFDGARIFTFSTDWRRILDQIVFGNLEI